MPSSALSFHASLPVLLVPGLMCDHAVWEPLLPWLGRAHSFTMVDHAGADSLQQMAQQMLDSAPPEFLLAGHSMGARVVLEAVRLAPARVRGVALLDTGYLPKLEGQAGEDEAAKRHALLQVAQTQGVRAMAQQWVKGMVHPDRLNDAELIARIIAMFERKSADIFARQITALLSRPDASDVLSGLTVPTLLMCGAQDAWSPPAQHQAMLDLAPTELSQFDLIEQAGHMAPMERPEPVAASLLRWLARCAVFESDAKVV